MEKNSTLIMMILPAAEEARHSVTPTDSMEEHQYFFIDIFHNLVASNLPKVNTDSKANTEFIKPERQEISYCKDNHICVYGSDYHFAKSLSCKMRNVEQNARICLLMGTWLDILDVAHVILCGDDHVILCADDHLPASFASLYAIGQMAKQFRTKSILLIISSREVIYGRNICWHRPTPQMFDKPRGPGHMHNCIPVQDLDIYPRMNTFWL